ncbi:MAG TPA: hypothetical protein VIV66_13710, partial [Pyrinomonadaceae bacterium]
KSEADKFEVEIIDFKTNRLRTKTDDRVISAEKVPQPTQNRNVFPGQILLDFMTAGPEQVAVADNAMDLVSLAARDYQLQMQAYALAVRLLIPSIEARVHKLNVTLHFLEPNVEFRLPPALLNAETCATAIDAAMLDIVSSLEPQHFPAKPFTHCRMCNFLGICKAGQEWLAQS